MSAASRANYNGDRTMTTGLHARWLTAIQVIGIALIVSGCSNQNPEADAAAAAGQQQFEIVNIDGNLYQAGVRGMGGHTTVFLTTPDGCNSATGLVAVGLRLPREG